MFRTRPIFWTVLLCVGVLGAGGAAVSADAGAGAEGQEAYDWGKWREFWAFKPVVKHDPPAVSNAGWVRNPIDAFILARLEAAGLAPAPEASRDVLIRRATFDLTGLPPTPEEIRAFRADESPDAYEKLIERLLASPHYGERWGRHWLDVARYVPGRVNFQGVKHAKGDAHYRDYVVRAFNADKPYDVFVTEQLAGDLLPPSPDRQRHYDQITAPAFLSIGSWFDMETDPNRLRLEMVDEQVNTTTRAFLGLSVACARCHDHKFDPVPTEDYYALGGVFRSTRLVGEFSEFWRDGRVRQLRPLAMPDEVAADDAVRAKIDAKKAELWQFLTAMHEGRMARWRGQERAYRDAGARARPAFVKLFEAEAFEGQDNLRIAQLMRDGKAVEVLETQTPGQQWAKYVVEVPETGRFRLEGLYSTDDGESPLYVQVNGKTITEAALGEPTGGWDLKFQRWALVAPETFELRKGVNFIRIGLKAGTFPRVDRFRLYQWDEASAARVAELARGGGGRPAAAADGGSGGDAGNGAPAALDERLLVNFAVDPEHPWPTVGGMVAYADEQERPNIDRTRAEAAALAAGIAPYEQIVAVTDQPAPVDLPVHLRGETYSVSDQVVPRGTLRLFDHLLPRPVVTNETSGRLELARWMTDARNPLPARVMANRVWHWHFGRGIVATPSDFGSQGESPTHPELLDWLAATFVDNGWSIKQLHRLIVTSNTYRMASASGPGQSPGSTAADPENRLLSRFPVRRLEAEAIYDAMRSTTNMIPRQASGQPLDYEKSAQRAMYVLTNGRAPQGLGAEVRKFFGLFDYDMSAAPIAARQTSQTAAQSLFWMNSPLVKFMAERFSARLLKMDRLDDARRVEMAYLLALGREPGEAMKQQALAYIGGLQAGEGASREAAWAAFCQALYGTAEFRYLE
jgi:hypothetical protein